MEEKKQIPIVQAYGKLIDVLKVVDIVLGPAFLSAITFQVFRRYVFNSPIYGLDEWVAFAMIWYSAFGSVIVSWEEGHARIEFLLAKLPSSWRYFWNCCEYIALILVGVVFVIGGNKLFKMQLRTAVVGGIPFSRAYYYALPAIVMGGLLSIMGIVRLIEFVADKKAFSQIQRGGTES